jgi:hypothetical protein
MPTRTDAAPQVHLHWVRETPSRALEQPVSSTLTSLDGLPPSARQAVADAAPRAPNGAVELHLPPAGKSSDLPGGPLSFLSPAPGLVHAHAGYDENPEASRAAHYAVLLVLRAISGDATPLSLFSPAGVVTVSTGLAAAPAERSRDYARVYKELSLRLQSAIRAAALPVLLPGVDWDNRPLTLSLLVWAAAKPVVGAYVDQLAVDVLDGDSVRRAYRGLPLRLAPLLAPVRDALAARRAPAALVEAYSPAQASAIAEYVRRHSRLVDLLFSNERRLITALVHFLSRIPEWRDAHRDNPLAAYRQIRRAWPAVEAHTRDFYRRRPCHHLAPLVLLEAVRSLQDATDESRPSPPKAID